MKIEPLTNGSLRVWLSEEELDKWVPDGDGPSQRRGVRRLLRRIFLQAEQIPPCRLAAELIPVEGGGVLLISPTTQARLDGPVVYRFAQEDDLLSFLHQWRQGTAPLPYLCLYEKGRGYDLAVYPAEPLTRRQQRLLAEYGMFLGAGEGMAAYCGERERLLAAGTLVTAPVPPPPTDGELFH